VTSILPLASSTSASAPAFTARSASPSRRRVSAQCRPGRTS
jgi:hypothetical protein